MGSTIKLLLMLLFAVMIKHFVIIFSAFLSFAISAETKKYELNITSNTGHHPIKFNNQIPGPTLEAIVGDILEVTVNNKTDVDTSVHWHGVLLPNNQDGVPYLTTPPIGPHSSFTYRFPITHAGTYWYHSHSSLQEQSGLYGALVFYPKNYAPNNEHVLVLSDWNDNSPHQTLKNIKRDGEYYALKKDTVQSWYGVLTNGIQAIKNRLNNSLNRMDPMDISDIGYDQFWVNGKTIENIKADKNQEIKLRIINASASSYFYVNYAGGDIKIVAADGVDVKPVNVNQLKIAIAETYDIIVTVPENNNYELRATAEDISGYNSTFIGNGNNVYIKNLEKINLYTQSHDQHHHMSHHAHEYMHLRSLEDTSFEGITKIIDLKLTGNMERYTWSFDNKILSEADSILIKKGEIVRINLINQTMMHHPIHLHGHFFRVLNGNEQYSPLKHTVNVPPMQTVTIEFLADKEGDWFFHCHNLYHMMSGMARVFSYEDYTNYNSDIKNKISHDPWLNYNNISIASNLITAEATIANTRNSISLDLESDYEKEYDIDILYSRNINLFTDLFAGVNLERSDKFHKPESIAFVGFKYLLPLLIEFELRYDNKGQFRAEFGSHLQLTNRINFAWMWNTEHEYSLKTTYEYNKILNIIGIYDSDYQWGIGLSINF